MPSAKLALALKVKAGELLANLPRGLQQPQNDRDVGGEDRSGVEHTWQLREKVQKLHEDAGEEDDT